ncbi:MAG: MFS transporter [Peptococcaceae bacterium]|nr:MFS transporter [Peptococcaceae bacterium]
MKHLNLNAVSVLALGLMCFVAVASETAMNVIFPTLMKEFDIPTSTVQWVTTVTLLMLAIVIPTSSWLTKRFKMKNLFIAAWILFTIGTLLGIWSPNFTVLIIARMLQGISGGITIPLMNIIILEQVPFQNTATIMGLATMTIVLGPALGPAFGGMIVGIAGWRMIFGCMLPILIIAGIFGITCIRQSRVLQKAPFDVISFLLLGISFFCIIYPLSAISHVGFGSPTIWLMFALAVVLLVLFKKHCNKVEKPLLNLAILKTPCFTFCLITLLLCQFVTLTRGFMIPNLFQLHGGVTAFVAGCIVLPACIISAVMNPFSGRIYDTIGPKIPITTGFILILIGLAIEAVFMVRVSAFVMMGIAIIYCVGQSLAIGNTTTFALRNLPGDQYGDGTAVITTLQQLFGAIGTAVASTLVTFGQAALPDDIAQGTANGTQWALYLNLALGIVMFICAMKGLRSGKKQY